MVNIIEGNARLDRRTKNLVKRLRPGEIAIIDHEDLDRVSAESLVEARPTCVVNASKSISGRYPNAGPYILLLSEIHLVDGVGPGIFEAVREGDRLQIEDGKIYLSGEVVAQGKALTIAQVQTLMEESKENLSFHLEEFASNTLELIKMEKGILFDSVILPEIKTKIKGKHVLVVVRGYEFKKDLAALKPYIREFKPVLLAVDGGADALLEMGYRPQMIVGDMDSVSDRALLSGAELVVHGYPDGRVPGMKRLKELGVSGSVFSYPGTSEDVAMLLAYELGADLIVLVGGHSNLIEYLDKDRKGMSSTFLVRLRVGSRLVDAKGLSKIYQQRVRSWHLIIMVLAALITISIVIAFSEPVRQFLTILAMRFQVWILKLQSLI